MVVALVRDLLFLSKLTAAARAGGKELLALRNPAALEAQPPGVRRLIVDANLDGALPAAAAYKCRSPETAIVAFVAHTDTQTIALARKAGVDRLMARSAFFAAPDSFLD